MKNWDWHYKHFVIYLNKIKLQIHHYQHILNALCKHIRTFFTSTKNFVEILIETLKKTSKASNYASNHAQFTFFNGSNLSNLTQMLLSASSEQIWNY